ncbi:MAG TPA: hypothetical protein DIS68_01155 [Lachnospiraceae bacterium]|nr:hypothetical protein [Lachnospiraceae bacterium]HBB60046.1 hypothetical protein [Lachnospiraceae bacterium]HCR99405.1 hypothetical protein [Lachnospiraceae bacterium]
MKGRIGRLTADRRFWTALYVLMALLAVVSVYEGICNALEMSQDFQYDAACALINGYDPYDLSLDFSKDRIPDIEGLKQFYGYFEGMGTPQKMEANQFPSLLYILTPYALMPYIPARILWLITNLLCTGVIIGLLRNTFMSRVDERLYPVFMMLMLAGTPWRNQLGVGQHTLFAVACFILAVTVAENGREEKSAAGTAAAGLLLSLSYLKYTVTAPLALYFIYRRRWKEFVISLVPHAVLTGVAAFILKEPYTDMLTKPLAVASALTGEGSIDVGVLTGGAAWSTGITAAVMLFILALALMMPEGNDELFISTAALLSLVMTYHRTYDYFIMIIVFGYFATGRMRAAQTVYLITTFAIFFVLRIYNESVISLTVSGALYYACVIAFVVISAEKVIKNRREQ